VKEFQLEFRAYYLFQPDYTYCKAIVACGLFNMDEKNQINTKSTSSTLSSACALEVPGGQPGFSNSQGEGPRGPPKEILLPQSRLIPLSIAYVKLAIRNGIE